MPTSPRLVFFFLNSTRDFFFASSGLVLFQINPITELVANIGGCGLIEDGLDQQRWLWHGLIENGHDLFQFYRQRFTLCLLSDNWLFPRNSRWLALVTHLRYRKVPLKRPTKIENPKPKYNIPGKELYQNAANLKLFLQVYKRHFEKLNI